MADDKQDAGASRDVSSDGPSDGRGPTVPDHELIRRIGRGSYGEVWLARGVLGKLRAVKVVYRKRFHDARPYEREFSGILRTEPLSRTHEGFVDILHVGRHEPEGYFYYVMELADDAGEENPPARQRPDDTASYQPRTLARELKHRGALDFQDCVQLGLNLSGALSQLHQHGLIHRDVKPSNILYVGAMPKLGDIGLVGEAGASGSYVGTEGYIPPEGPGTPQADLFSLGKVLYEAATGQDRLAFPVLLPGAMDEPTRSLLAELNAVFLKACAPDPRARYQSAEELHADLALLHCGQSVRQQRRRERRWQQVSLAGYAGMALLGLLAGGLWSPWQRTPGSPGATNEIGIAPLPKLERVDLAPFYNASLGTNWLRDFRGNDLASLPTGWQHFGSAWFEAGGLIQLCGRYTQSRELFFPDALKDIAIGRRAARLHFLHGTVWSAETGAHVGSYVVHYADGRKEEIPLRYNEAFRNWWWTPRSSLKVAHATVAWVGTNAATGPTDKLCLYTLTWNNPYPDAPIRSLDFVSTRSSSAPFLLAVTTE